MKGIFVFLALFFTVGLAWLFLSSKADDDKAYESRLIGALNFIEKSIPESVPGVQKVRLYSPLIEERDEPNRWLLVGVVETRDVAGGVAHGRFVAELEAICQAYARHECWHSVSLKLAGLTPSFEQLPSALPTESVDPGQEAKIPSTPTVAESEKKLALTGSDKDSYLAGETGNKLPEADLQVEPSPYVSEKQDLVPQGKLVPQGETVTVIVREGSEAVISGSASSSRLAGQTANLGRDTTNPITAGNGEELGREAVKRLQEILKRIGYDPGPADGIAGPRTASAIQNFQRQNGLELDDKPTAKLLELLERFEDRTNNQPTLRQQGQNSASNPEIPPLQQQLREIY